MPPSLEQLLLPSELPANGSTPIQVTDLPACGPTDSRMRRIVVNPAGDHVSFPIPEAVADFSASEYQNIDNTLLSRIMDSRGNFFFQTDNGVRFAPLCYDASATTQVNGQSRYSLYVANVPALQNPPQSPALRGIPFSFRPAEITALVADLRIPNVSYGVSPSDPTQFMIMPDTGTVDRVIAWIEVANSPIAVERRAPMVEAFRTALTPEYAQKAFQGRAEDSQRQMGERMDRMDMWNRVMMGAMIYISAKQMGLTDRLDSFIANAARALLDTPGNIWRRDFASLGREWMGLFRTRNSVVTDLTDRLMNMSIPLTEGSRQILEGFDRGEMPNVIFGGPSGSGKGYSTEAAFAAALQGQSGVEAFEGRHLRAYRISVGAIVEKAGSWLNGGEKEFLRALKQIPDGSLIQLTEADQLAKCGMGSGNEPLNLLPRLYNIMEQRPGISFVLESTRWPIIEAAAPDLLRRTSFGEVLPPLPQEVRQALDAGVAMRRSGDKGPVLQRRYSRYTFDAQAMDAIAALGAFERGAPPSSHLMVMDRVMADVARSRRDGSGGTEITQDDVIRLVAQSTNSTEERVRGELQAMLEVGIENNTQIEARIVEGFYRAYPHPKNGFVNPLEPNRHPAFVTNNGERIDLPPGAYSSAREAMNAGNPAPATSAAPQPAAAQPAGGNGGNGHGSTITVTEENIAREIRARYPALRNSRNNRTVREIAREVLLEWQRTGSRVDTTQSAIAGLPAARIVDTVTGRYFERLTREDAARAETFRRGERDRSELSERDRESLGREILESMRRAPERAREGAVP